MHSGFHFNLDSLLLFAYGRHLEHSEHEAIHEHAWNVIKHWSHESLSITLSVLTNYQVLGVHAVDEHNFVPLVLFENFKFFAWHRVKYNICVIFLCQLNILYNREDVKQTLYICKLNLLKYRCPALYLHPPQPSPYHCWSLEQADSIDWARIIGSFPWAPERSLVIS